MDQVIDIGRVARVFRDNREAFAAAKPFPHIVLDGLFDEDLLRSVAAEYPDVGAMDHVFSAHHEAGKGQTSRWSSLGPNSSLLIAYLNSGDFLEQLEELTGIEHLVADTKLEGGGQHQISSGGRLGVHADFNRNEDNGLHRRLNFLLYLNEDWDEDWGGHLELWDVEMTEAVERVVPALGRMVIFATTSTSYHGHPDPLQCPEDVTRKSIALYYYSNDHRDEDLSEQHTTLFQVRPGSELDRQNDLRTRRAQLAHRWLPPALHEMASKAKHRIQDR